MIVRLTQLDGALPNLALMRLAAWHKAAGDEVRLTRQIEPDLFEPGYDRVYGSALFSFSEDMYRDSFERPIGAWCNAVSDASDMIKELAQAKAERSALSRASGEAVAWQTVVAAIRAVGAEASRRGQMYPQTSDEQREDRKAIRNVIETLEFYAAQSESLPDWPKLAAPTAPGMCLVPEKPTEEMLNAARDWSAERIGKPIGNAAAIGCWQAMFAAAKGRAAT